MKKALALATLLLIVPGPAMAQGRRTIPYVRSAGATIGMSNPGDPRSGGGPGPQLAGNVEVPVHEKRLRLTLGHIRWTPTNRASAAEEAGRIGQSRLTATLIVPHIEPTVRYPFGFYRGFGFGVYRYHIPHGQATHRTAGGVHVLGGMEFMSKDQRRVLRVEGEMSGVAGPGHEQVWAVVMFGGSVSVGVSRRF